MALPPEKIGIVLVDHGSKVDESNALLEEIAAVFLQRCRWTIVEPAHMELAEPSVQTAFTRCVEQGAERVIVMPYFLGPGRHSRQDIPRLAEAAAEAHDGVDHVVTAPLGLHDLLLEVVDQRIEESL